jgi:hypothetical protein
MDLNNKNIWIFQKWYIPERMQGGILRYIEHGIEPGHFLSAVFRNDFVGIAGRADDENLENLPAYANFLYNYAPQTCWGSKEKVDNWIERKKKIA